jgi:hypothetical protein
MSIDYGVNPLDPDNKDFRDWLHAEGVDFPDVKGRFPTLDELLDVLHTFNGLAVNVEKNEVILVSLGDRENLEPGFALMLGHITPDGYYDFFFWQSGNQAITMAAILKKLSVFCGPLVLREGYGATPMLVTQDTHLDIALQEWNDRFRQKYPE